MSEKWQPWCATSLVSFVLEMECLAEQHWLYELLVLLHTVVDSTALPVA